MKIRSQGVIKLAFNGKSKNTSLFTYNLQKETQEQLEAKLREKVIEFFSFYSELNHKTPIKYFEAYSSDFICMEGCSISIATKISMIQVLYPIKVIEKMLKEEGEKFGIIVDLKLQA
jgi:hypothetical protein